MDDLEQRGLSTEPLQVSGNAHLIMPWHIALDGASEKRLGKLQIGTTRRGIGPAYADKAARIGIRVQDLLDAKILRQKIETALAEKNVVADRAIYELEPFDARGRRDAVRGLRAAAAAVRRGHVAARRPGASRRQARAARRRPGHAPRPRPRHLSLRDVVEPGGRGGGDGDRDRADADRRGARRREGVRDARRRRAVPERDGREGRRAACASSGRSTARSPAASARPGWLDLVALRYAVRLNGITSLALTKLDVLSVFDELQVCVRYRLPDGTETADFPAHQSDFHHCEPVFETVAGLARAARRVRDARRSARGRARLRRARRARAGRHRRARRHGRGRATRCSPRRAPSSGQRETGGAKRLVDRRAGSRRRRRCRRDRRPRRARRACAVSRAAR